MATETKETGISFETRQKMAEVKKVNIDQAIIDLCLKVDSEEIQFDSAVECIRYVLAR